ncbi:MAG: murein tripeptide amidase MpaA [Verrucomicrobiae bacterium]|nr:murein tripeptide amidase MpaA [Verrucomicrobiae bacterium]
MNEEFRRTDLRFATEPFGLSVRGAALEWVPPKECCRILILAGQHGEEPETTVSLSRALRSLASPPDHVGCVLAANPDGLTLGTRGNAHGVDLNRNFPTADWQEANVGVRWHVDEPGSGKLPIGTGSSPGSEPETRALIDLIDRHCPEQVIALHAPLACIDDPLDSPAGRWLSERTGLPLVTEIGYPTPGSFGTWAAERGLPVITWEFPKRSIEDLSRDAVPVLIQILEGGMEGLLG